MRKCNLVLLVMPCMLSLMLPAQAGDWHYTPLQLNGLNADLVAGPGESLTDAMDHDGWCFYADNRQARGGLPQELHGMFSDIPYVLENFDGACALQLCSPVKDAQKGTSYGSVHTITFPPTQARTFWILATAGNGPATMKTTIHYADNTTSATTTQEVKDWLASSYSGTAFWQLGRLDATGTTDDRQGTQFALYELPVSADPAKTATSMTIELGDKGSFLSVFAVTATDKEIPTETREKKLFFLSDAHMDTQWNWTVQTTIAQYVKNTLTQNFERFDDADDRNFSFNFEGAIKYMWAKEYYPTEYARLKNYIKQGKWNISGASIDANDVNTVSGESLIRNFLLGQKFYEKEFGVRGGTDVMLPDCFGFPWSLPTAA